MKNSERPARPTNARMHSEMTGLTKREYFAAMAMQGILSSNTEKAAIGIVDSEHELIALASVRFADELIKRLGE